jgi:hypothetical protein
MAAVVGVVSAKHGTTKPVGPLPPITITTEQEVFVHYVEVIFPAGTYVQADDATIDPTAVLQSSRSGKTFTVLGAMCAGHGDENGSIVHVGIPTTIVANLITLPITQEDGTTERGASAMSAVWNRPITVALYVAETPFD